MRRFVLMYGLPLLLIPWAISAAYTVDKTEYAYVTRFGQPIVTRDGDTEAGLHFKFPWPIEAVQRVDRRLQIFDLTPTETLTRDRLNSTVDKTIAVDAYVCWRIPDADSVDRFVRTVGTAEQAKQVLGSRIRNRLAAVISRMPFDDLIQVDDIGTTVGTIVGVAASPVMELPAWRDWAQARNLESIDRRMERIRRQLLGLEAIRAGEEEKTEKLREVAATYGIELVDVRLRRFNYPETVRPSIYERIKSDRMLKATDYATQGRERADAITAEAEARSQTIERSAAIQSQLRKDQADIEADRIRNQAHALDPEFYAMLRERKALRELFSDSTATFLLSTTQGPFRWLFQMPSNKGTPAVPMLTTPMPLPPENKTP